MLSPKRLTKLKQTARNRQAGFVLVLEDIHDPNNAGAIIRSADAFGIQNVYFIFNKEPFYDLKKIEGSSSGSAKWVDIHIYKSTKDCLDELINEGFKIVVTVLDETAENLYETKFNDLKLALMIGNEQRGLSKEAISLADKKICLPMRGMVQSLNAAVAAGIFLYEINRQRQKQPRSNYQFNQAGIDKILNGFLSPNP